MLVTSVLWNPPAHAARESAKTMKELQSRYSAFLTLEPHPSNDSRFDSEIRNFDEEVQRVLDAQIIDASDSHYRMWYTNEKLWSKELTLNGAWTRYVWQMALAYSRPASRFHRDPVILERIVLALEGYGEWVYPGCPKPGNWWAWDIGMPRHLVDVYFLLRDELPQNTSEFLKQTLGHLMRKNPVPGLGANAIWVAWIQFRFGMASENEQCLQWGWETLNRQSTIRQKPGEGIKPDYSYHFHAPGMNMGYGLSHYHDMSLFIFITHGTPYAMEDESSHVRWFLEFVRWIADKGLIDPYARGRDGTRRIPTNSASVLLEPTLALIASDLPERKELIAEFRRLAQTFPEKISLPFANEQLDSETSSIPPACLDTFRFYPYSSYGVWRGDGFFASLRLDSARNKKWFSIMQENLLGHRITDGHIALWVDGLETDQGVLACQDWEKLTGITGADGFVLPQERVGQTTLTAGLSLDGKYGLASMDLLIQPDESGPSLKAKKTYFLLSDAVICIVSNAVIEPTAEIVPYTVLSQIPWTDETTQPALSVGGTNYLLHDDANWDQSFRWAHFRSRGIVNLSCSSARFSWQRRTFPWSRVDMTMAPNEDFTSEYSHRFLSIERVHEDHSPLAFALLPALDATATAQWAQKPPVDVLRCDERAHIVRYNLEGGKKLLAMAFFKASRDRAFAAGAPLITLMKLDDKKIRFAFANLNADATESTTLRCPILLEPGEYQGVMVKEGEQRGETLLELPATGLTPLQVQVPSRLCGGKTMKELRKKVAWKKRRIIYDNDGNEPVYYCKDATPQSLLDCRTTGLVGTQVDTVLYCTWSSGFSYFTHNTKVGQVFDRTEEKFSNNKTREFLDKGLDPLKIVVDYCHANDLEVFWSFRVNDTHDAANAWYGPLMVPQLKKDHPEYLLGSKENRPAVGAWSSMNFGLPEVRDLAFRFVEEVCLNYDVDGVHLDFFRHAMFFKNPSMGLEASQEERDQMTDLMRRIRAMADEVGASRGRPILISIRVPDSVDYSSAIGLDVEQWLEHDLVDILTVSGYFRLNAWEYSVELGHKYGVPVYPSLDETRFRDEPGKIRGCPESYRARAMNAWASGMDGILLFNYYKGNSDPLYDEVGDPKTLIGLDKNYTTGARQVWMPNSYLKNGERFVNYDPLSPERRRELEPGESTTIELNVGEQLEESGNPQVMLCLQFDGLKTAESIAVTLNGNSLTQGTLNEAWLEVPLKPSLVRKGINVIQVNLNRSSEETMVLKDLVLKVRY